MTMRFSFTPVAAVILAVSLLTVPFAMAEAKTKHAHHKVQAPPPQLIPIVPPVLATYDVYLGGIHFISADITFEEKDGKYHARMLGHTVGIWDKLFPWRTELIADGSIRSDKFIPAEYAVHDEWSHKPKTTKVHFNAKGDPAVEFDPPQGEDNHLPMTVEQKRGSLDPVTGLLQMLASIAVQNTCNITVPIFEGHMRFDIAGADVGTEEIDEEDYGIYKGMTRTCDANFTLVAGEWKNKTKSRFWTKSETERGREPFHLWLARPDPNLPELPVRIETGSVWGNVYIHLSAWHTVK